MPPMTCVSYHHQSKAGSFFVLYRGSLISPAGNYTFCDLTEPEAKLLCRWATSYYQDTPNSRLALYPDGWTCWLPDHPLMLP